MSVRLAWGDRPEPYEGTRQVIRSALLVAALLFLAVLLLVTWDAEPAKPAPPADTVTVKFEVGT